MLIYFQIIISFFNFHFFSFSTLNIFATLILGKRSKIFLKFAFYLFDLASEFHALYTLGTGSPHLRFIIQDDRQLTEARLVLVQGVATVLASGLALLGVEAPNEMR